MKFLRHIFKDKKKTVGEKSYRFFLSFLLFHSLSSVAQKNFSEFTMWFTQQTLDCVCQRPFTGICVNASALQKSLNSFTPTWLTYTHGCKLPFHSAKKRNNTKRPRQVQCSVSFVAWKNHHRKYANSLKRI